MSVPKVARIVSSERIAGGFHELRCESSQRFDYTAGQYVILHSDLPNPEKPGQVLKKAYSFSSAPDRAPAPSGVTGFTFTVATVGAMSGYVASRRPGDEIRFSGPWGKTFLHESGVTSPVHLIATGSGFSPIGSLAAAFLDDDRAAPVSLCWEVDTPYHGARLDRWCADSRFRAVVGLGAIEHVAIDAEALYYLAGDGRAIDALVSRLGAGGVAPERIRTEVFFR